MTEDPLLQLTTRAGWADPYPIHTAARRRGQVARSDLGAVVVTGHAECSEALKSPDWQTDPRHNPATPIELAGEDVSLLSLDPPDHTRLRKLVARSFSARAIDKLSQIADSYAAELVSSAVRKGRVEVMSELAYPLPLAVICHLLGVPQEDRKQIGRWGYDLSPGLDLNLTGVPAASVLAASEAVNAYFAELIERKRQEPSDDVVGQLLEAQRSGAELTDGELLNLCSLILLAGFVTTVNLIGNGLFTLLSHPEQLRACMTDAALIPPAVEEMLRYESPVQYTGRYPGIDYELGGVHLAAGQQAILMLGAANRDPLVFDDPDRFDITRANANEHIAFATGIHHCLGSALARLEAKAFFAALAEQATDVRLAGEARLRPVSNLRGFEVLPVQLAAS
jgi:cytochrome P450